MVVKITPYGGVGDEVLGELGGVQILINDVDLDTRIMLDFGQRPDHSSQFYTFPQSPRPLSALEVISQLQLYPSIEGLYRHDFERHRGRTVGDLPIDALLLTHTHQDHIGGIHYLRHDLPMYIHEDHKKMLFVYQEFLGASGQYVYIKDNNTLMPNLQGGQKFATGDMATLHRDIRLYETNKRFKIGNMWITAYPVDHSIPAACGFILETSAGKMAFTGDIRYRGRRPQDTEAFQKALVDQDVKYVWCEGSLLHFDHYGKEEDISDVVANLIKNKGFAGVAYPPRDCDRLAVLYEAAKVTGRMLVINPQQASLLKILDGKYDLPRLNWKYIGVYIPPKRHGLLDRDFPADMVEQDYLMYERLFLNLPRAHEHEGKPQRVSIDDLKNRQGDFLTFVQASHMIDLFNYIQPQDGVYLRCHPGPWTVEMEVQENRQVNILKENNFDTRPTIDYLTPVMRDEKGTRENWRRIPTVHVTGHMNRFEKKAFLDPLMGTIIPMHTFRVPIFINEAAKGKRVLVPTRKKEMILT